MVEDHSSSPLEATLRMPGQDPETVYIISSYDRGAKYLVAFPHLSGYDLGELGATVKVPASMLFDVHPAS